MILRKSFPGSYWRLNPDPPRSHHRESRIFNTTYQCFSSIDSSPKKQLDPFSLVGDEVCEVTKRLRSLVVAEIPELTPAAGYFFKEGVQGKRTCCTVLLLMATAMDSRITEHTSAIELRRRQRSLAEATEMIHVASLIHDNILDDADTRRGIGSLNFVMGNKLAVLAGDFLLSRAFKAFAALENTDVASLFAKAIEDLVTGETMQMMATAEQHCSMEYYMRKTYNKTASLISNSCKAVTLLSGQTAGAADLAFEYGKNLGLACQLIDDILDFTGTSASLGKGSLSDIRNGIITAPILFALEEFPQLRAIINEGFDSSANVDVALEYLWKSRGIERTRELAERHSDIAAAAIDSLPESSTEDVRNARKALAILTQRFIRRNK